MILFMVRECSAINFFVTLRGDFFRPTRPSLFTFQSHVVFIRLLEMGSKKKLAQKLEKAKHANSRRTLAVIRDIKKIKKREKVKGDFAIKVNVFKNTPLNVQFHVFVDFRPMLKPKDFCSSRIKSKKPNLQSHLKNLSRSSKSKFSGLILCKSFNKMIFLADISTDSMKSSSKSP